ncbi:MAG: FAD-binding protein, partial [Thermotogota bacterium]|nr:FAD-binding protein [Thermotogota bacterium]
MLKIPKQFQKIKITTEFKKFSHLKLGCALPYFFAPHSYLQLQKLLKWAVENDLKILPVGGASNILMKKPQNIAVILDKDLPQFLEFDNNNLQCSTNFNINFILMLSTFHNLGGLEFLAGIPANLGGIIKMNAGAYGKNISEFIDNVTVMQNDGELKKIPDSSIFFDYRYCSLDGFILKTKLKLKNDQNSKNNLILTVRDKYRENKRKKKDSQAIRQSIFRIYQKKR